MGVVGVGGFIFRSNDPEKLRKWYAEHLGVGTGEHGEWETKAGPSVFMPFAQDSDYFAPYRQWMLNLRVEGLDALLEKLRSEGIEVTTKREWNVPGIGSFARIHDPEGNPLELWEPAEEDK
jgi:predicted enzyme related to lactoylglutathione lyase